MVLLVIEILETISSGDNFDYFEKPIFYFISFFYLQKRIKNTFSILKLNKKYPY